MTPRRQPELMQLILQRVRKKGYLGDKDIESIALRLRIPSSLVYGFFSQFDELPSRPHKTLVRVCMGPACALEGAEEVLGRLRQSVPADAEVTASPGLGRWHHSPALVIEPPEGEALLFEGLKLQEIEKIASGISGEGMTGGRTLADVLPPPVETVAGSPASPWSASLERECLPEGWGPELVEWAAGNAGEAMKRIKGVFAAAGAERRGMLSLMERAAADTSTAKVLICDGVGEEVENNLNYSLPLMHPRAVAAGALLAGAVCGAKHIIFYLSWKDGSAAEKIEAAVEELPPLKGTKISVFRGPEHVPSTPHIGRAAVIQGMMLWRAASLYGWEVPEIADRPCLLIPADLAWKLPWVLQEQGGEPTARAGGRLEGIAGCMEGPRLVEVPSGMSPADLVSRFGPLPGGGGCKAVHLGGGMAGPLPIDAALEKGYGEGSEILLLPASTCMAAWALYLAQRAERSCCGGCAPGRQAPAVAAEIIRSILKAEAGAEEAARLEALLVSAGELAMCPRLERVLEPVLSCLRSFPGEFEAHAVEGTCRAGSCAQLVREAT